MILALDVHYKENYAKNVGVLFDWMDAEPHQVIVTQTADVEEYVPGEFYKRELPCLLDVMTQVNLEELEAIIVDGHVYIDNTFTYGLGGHFWEAIQRKVPVIGIAKRHFHLNEKTNIPILRGSSKNPLYVSAIGMDLDVAVEKVNQLHGINRIPTILKILDSVTKLT